MRPLPPICAQICMQGTQPLSPNPDPGAELLSSFGQWFTGTFSGRGRWQLWQAGQDLVPY